MIILLAAASLLNYGYSMYNQTNLLTQAHNLGMLEQQKVSYEVTYAGAVIIYSAKPSAPLINGYHCLYTSTDSRLARDTGTASGTNKTDYVFMSGYYTGLKSIITYSCSTKSTLNVDIKINDKNNKLLYDTQTDILINNGTLDTTYTSSGNAVVFQIPS